MEQTKRMRAAIIASIAVNGAAVAMLGVSDLVHPHRASAKRSASTELHPVRIANASELHLHDPTVDPDSHPGDRQGDGSDGPSDGSAGSRDNAGTGDGRPGGKAASTGDGRGGGGAAPSDPSSTQSQSGSQRSEYSQLPPGAARSVHAPQSDTNAGQTTNSGTVERHDGDRRPPDAYVLASEHSTREGREGHGVKVAELGGPQSSEPAGQSPIGRPSTLNGRDLAGMTDGNNPQGAKPGSAMQIVKTPGTGARTGHGGHGGSSMAPKMIVYPAMKVNLGTVHVTRPPSGNVGGGSADMRKVDITAHYVIDDPWNIPKHPKPDKIVKMFPSHCDGDKGNTSKCVHVGGNTSLGGTTLHGHNHISGMKYCVPGAPGIVAGGSGSGGGGPNPRPMDPDERAQGHGRQLASELFPGSGTPVSNEPVAPALKGNFNDPKLATFSNPVHLPSTHDDIRGLTPGATVPVEDRKWVYNPEEHTESAPEGRMPASTSRFSITPKSIGSTSAYGTVEWQTPHKSHKKRLPRGGDGTGLLGMYYNGNSFQHLVMSRPDRDLDFDWSAQGPDPRVLPLHEYSVRWLGKLVPRYSEVYTIAIASDDGERLYIDGKLVICNWTTHAASEDATQIYLEAGREYNVKIEYFENSYGDAIMKMYWQSPHQPKEYIPEACLRYPKRLAAKEAAMVGNDQ